MIELPLIFVGGLLGSSHCVGMCGPLAIALGMPSTDLSHNFRRQLLFSLGRLSTYGFIGALSAFASLWLSRWSWLAVSLQGLLALVGGVALVILGLATAGVLPRLKLGWIAPQSCAAAGWLKTLLLSPSAPGALLAGVFTGFIPCGLVYGFLAVAAASGDVIRGWLIMTTFGLGTMPLLLLTGCGATMLSVAVRARILQVAAWCVVVAGAISIARGAGDLRWGPQSQPPSCPFCNHTDTVAPN
jgi:sulfite exporter TauE/SafE